MKTFSTSDVVDVVVIGTGAGAAPLLAKLSAAGLRVVAIEAGPWFMDPQNDFATDEVDAAKIYWLDERLSAGDTPIVFGANNSGTGVGGSMLHWGAFVPRAYEGDLHLHSETGHGVDWPLSYADLKPYYEELEGFLGVSGPSYYPWDPSRHYPLPPIAVNEPGRLMQKGFKALGMKTSEAPIAAVSQRFTRSEYGTREACVNRGFCHQGCRNGAKASMDVTYLPWAVKNGAEIREKCMVFDFERSSNGKITGVLYRDFRTSLEGVESSQRCLAVVLCAGAVETPRLLLHAGIANGSGQVGRNFLAHVATQVWGTFDHLVRMNLGFPATVISEDLLRPMDANFAGGYIVQSLGVVPVTWAQSVARGRGLFGTDFEAYFDQYNFVAGIGINGNCLESDKNYLELSGELDKSGLPKPRVHFSYGANELEMDRHASSVLSQAWKAAGASDLWTLRRTAHVIGTCRMGNDSGESVVDSFGKSHDLENLWICDNSVFPSALAANPALTIMALSLRTAEAMLKT